jgi:hypothetical protein
VRYPAVVHHQSALQQARCLLDSQADWWVEKGDCQLANLACMGTDTACALSARGSCGELDPEMARLLNKEHFQDVTAGRTGHGAPCRRCRVRFVVASPTSPCAVRVRGKVYESAGSIQNATVRKGKPSRDMATIPCGKRISSCMAIFDVNASIHLYDKYAHHSCCDRMPQLCPSISIRMKNFMKAWLSM